MKCLIKAGILSAVLLLLLGPTQAQTNKLRFEHININNGLSHNDVMQIKQDSKGYIWIGTLDGLNKYDGYQFTNYQREPYDTTSLTMNAITGIWESTNGMLWVHPVNSDLNRFDSRTETFSVVNPLPSENTLFDPRLIQDLEEDAEGMVWVYNYEVQLCRFDKTNNRLVGRDYSEQIFANPYNKGNTSKWISDLYKDKRGILWIGNSEGLHQLHLTPGKEREPSQVSFTHYWHNPGDTAGFPVNALIFEDHTGTFWLGSNEGLSRFDPQTKQIIHYRHEENNSNTLTNDGISSLAEDAQGNLWIATYNGLNRLDKDRKHFTRFYHDPTDAASLGGNFIMTLLIDKSNTLWTGTLQNGISKVNLNYHSFPVYQHNPFDSNSISHNMVTAIYEDKEGTVWIGSREGGLDSWNRSTSRFTHFRHHPTDPGSLYSDVVGAVLEDLSGNLWIGSGNPGEVVLSQMNRMTGHFKHHILKYPMGNTFAGPVLTIYPDKAGLFWIGTTNGVVTFDPVTKESHHYPHDSKKPEGLSDPWIFSFCEDSLGNMWIGTSTGRLNKLNLKTGQYTHYTYDPNRAGSISSNTARCIYKDSKGTLWFGTFGGGLCRLNPDGESFTAFTTKQGLPSNTIHAIQEDDEGNLWLATGKGLSKFSLASHTVTNYDAKDGLQSNQFTLGHSAPGASFKGRDGTLYFGGINGFNAFHPKHLQRNQYVPPIVINQFKLFDKPMPGTAEAGEITLSHNQNFFSFEFAALDYTNSQKNQYAYKLDGIDKDWVHSGTRRFASYTGVTPGRYVFHVKGTNSDGVWNEIGTTLLVIVRPPWWRTGWAYAFYGLCFLAAVFAIDRLQRQRLIRRERERAKEKELEHAKEIEKAYHQLKTTQAQLIQSEKMASLGALTAGIAHEIQNPLNFVTNFSDVNKELIAEMKAEIGKGNFNDVEAIANDIGQNEEKINHHGKRADAIVKNMLEHSRASKGERLSTDINALCDEYLRLSYHGLRAKDSSFNATFKTDFDESIGELNIIPQDIGRVLLNLFNNAFYAVSEKKKQSLEDYEPIVSVHTKKLHDKIEITVQDNGMGISKSVQDKIFQPFFTTKQTGQGTGLGLSLSYDIVKTHGGELNVTSEEGTGATFVIQLPA